MLLLLGMQFRAATLVSQTDSLNYAVGLLNGHQLKSQFDVLAKDAKAREVLLQAMDRNFALTEMPDELQRLGTEFGVSIADMSVEGLAHIKSWQFNSKVCLQAVVNGLYGDTAWKDNNAIEFFKSEYTKVAGNDSLKAVKQPKARLECPQKPAPVKLKSHNDSLNYAFGLLEGKQLTEIAANESDKTRLIEIVNKVLKNYTPYTKYEQIGARIGIMLFTQRERGLLGIKTAALNYPMVRVGINDGLTSKTEVFATEDAEQYLNTTLMRLQMAAQAAEAEEAKREGEAFLAVNGQRPEVTTTPSGLQYEVLREGTGTTHPTAESKVRVHYHGTLIDGTVFDSSVERGEPISFPLNGVIRGWTEGVQLMTEGAKYRFFIPYQLAYGERGAGGQIPPYAALIFEVELLEIEK